MSAPAAPQAAEVRRPAVSRNGGDLRRPPGAFPLGRAPVQSSKLKSSPPPVTQSPLTRGVRLGFWPGRRRAWRGSVVLKGARFLGDRCVRARPHQTGEGSGGVDEGG